jgi:hypothetical protein
MSEKEGPLISNFNACLLSTNFWYKILNGLDHFSHFSMDRLFYKWPLADTGLWFTMEIYKMYLWIKFVCLSVSRAALIPFSTKNIYFFCFVFRANVWPSQRWLLTLPLPPNPQTAIGCAGPWLFAWCANLAFLFFLPHLVHLEILASLSLQNGLRSGIIIGLLASQSVRILLFLEYFHSPKNFLFLEYFYS